jgi:hypothetical protein
VSFCGDCYEAHQINRIFIFPSSIRFVSPDQVKDAKPIADNPRQLISPMMTMMQLRKTKQIQQIPKP